MLRELVPGHYKISRWLAARRLRRRFREVPTFTLATLPEDTEGRVIGIVHADTPMTAPLSGRACAYWVIEIREHVGSGWPAGPLAREDRVQPFILEDGGHRALVDPARAELSVAFDHHSKSLAAFDATPAQQALLLGHGLVDRNWFNTEYLAYHEGIIGIGERIAILGAGTREPDPDARGHGAYRDAAPTRVVLTG